MIRLALLMVALFVSGAGVVWKYGFPEEQQDPADHVARAEPSSISLQPALSAAVPSPVSSAVSSAPVVTAPAISSVSATRPVARPETVTRLATIRPLARPANLGSAVVPTTPAIPPSGVVGVPLARAPIAVTPPVAATPVAPAPKPTPAALAPLPKPVPAPVPRTQAIVAPAPKLVPAPEPRPAPAVAEPFVPVPSSVAPVVAAPTDPAPAVIVPEIQFEQALPDTTDDVDDVTKALTAMSLGIISELQKPVSKSGDADKPRSTVPVLPVTAGIVLPARPVQPAPQPEPEPAGRTYVVNEGDSLPGIAYRFYGTTVAYLTILNANTDVLTSPSDLRAGMELRIPDGP